MVDYGYVYPLDQVQHNDIVFLCIQAHNGQIHYFAEIFLHKQPEISYPLLYTSPHMQGKLSFLGYQCVCYSQDDSAGTIFFVTSNPSSIQRDSTFGYLVVDSI